MSAIDVARKLERERLSSPMSAHAFVELLQAMLNFPDRKVTIKNPAPYRGGLVSLLGPGGILSGSGGNQVFVNFVNLPKGVGGAGGGAEAENNRMAFRVEGFGDEGAPASKVSIEMSVSALPRSFRLRKKTAPPGIIAKYLADFLAEIIATVPPRFTHTGKLEV
jgi:hypothetical protein